MMDLICPSAACIDRSLLKGMPRYRVDWEAGVGEMAGWFGCNVIVAVGVVRFGAGSFTFARFELDSWDWLSGGGS